MLTNKIFQIWPLEYPEDWMLIYDQTIESAMKQYFSEAEIEPVDFETFSKKYGYIKIRTIGSRTIKEIIFED